MTPYEQGFMAKCAEYGYTEEQASEMLKQAARMFQLPSWRELRHAFDVRRRAASIAAARRANQQDLQHINDAFRAAAERSSAGGIAGEIHFPSRADKLYPWDRTATHPRHYTAKKRVPDVRRGGVTDWVKDPMYPLSFPEQMEQFMSVYGPATDDFRAAVEQARKARGTALEPNAIENARQLWQRVDAINDNRNSWFGDQVQNGMFDRWRKVYRGSSLKDLNTPVTPTSSWGLKPSISPASVWGQEVTPEIKDILDKL